MEKFKRTFSLRGRKKKPKSSDNNKPFAWHEDEQTVRDGTASFPVKVLWYNTHVITCMYLSVFWAPWKIVNCSTWAVWKYLSHGEWVYVKRLLSYWERYVGPEVLSRFYCCHYETDVVCCRMQGKLRGFVSGRSLNIPVQCQPFCMWREIPWGLSRTGACTSEFQFWAKMIIAYVRLFLPAAHRQEFLCPFFVLSTSHCHMSRHCISHCHISRRCLM